MQKFNVLVLTDHAKHSSENSLYPLVRALRLHPSCAYVDVATRHNKENGDFFNGLLDVKIGTGLSSRQIDSGNFIHVSPVDDLFTFDKDGQAFRNKVIRKSLNIYNVIWLRMPPPLRGKFLDFLQASFPKQLIINDPMGIWLSGSKRFLTGFPTLCPPMRICESVEAITNFKSQFPIVLKPFREYGGRGLVRIDGEEVWMGKETMSFDSFISQLHGQPIEYLGVKYLKNVSQGDKRIVVVNGQIMGASLRLPAKDSWLCNVAMGGSSHFTKVEKEEEEIVAKINPVLSQMGIVMYGVDTLVGDKGKRVLSEINTTSIGGLPQIAQLTGKPLVKEAIDQICNHIVKKRRLVKV